MNNKTMSLLKLHPDEEARIINIEGGRGFRSKLRIMGIREGQRIKIISKQPFNGPITVTVNGCQLTIGRGMAQRIIIEEL